MRETSPLRQPNPNFTKIQQTVTSHVLGHRQSERQTERQTDTAVGRMDGRTFLLYIERLVPEGCNAE
jgi:hypothetical protein